MCEFCMLFDLFCKYVEIDFQYHFSIIEEYHNFRRSGEEYNVLYWNYEFTPVREEIEIMSLAERYLESRSFSRNVNSDEDGESLVSLAGSFNSKEYHEDHWSPSWYAD